MKKRFIDEFLEFECQIGKYNIRTIDILAMLIITIFAIIARVSMFNFASGDYNIFLSKWFEVLKEAGGLKGISLSLGDYTPPYIYILSLLTYLPIDSLFSIKIVSCIFDFACAFLVFKIAFEQTNKINISIIFYTLMLFAPTIILNSAFWAQCDMIFTFFLVLCIYYLTKDKPVKAIIFFSVAFTFKLQAIFLLPLLILMWLKNKCKLRYFLIIPITYLISIIPAFIMGRPLSELLTIYISQSGQYKSLSLNAPNFYLWLNNDYGNFLTLAGIILCIIAVGIILYLSYTYKIKLDSEAIVLYALLFSLVIPFLLPHMHERYFFIADVLSIVYCIYNRKKFYIPIMIILSSFISYCPFLFGTSPIKLEYMSLVIFASILLVMRNLIVKIKQS